MGVPDEADEEDTDDDEDEEEDDAADELADNVNADNKNSKKNVDDDEDDDEIQILESSSSVNVNVPRGKRPSTSTDLNNNAIANGLASGNLNALLGLEANKKRPSMSEEVNKQLSFVNSFSPGTNPMSTSIG